MQADATEQTQVIGRPTVYRPEYAPLAAQMCARGATLNELAVEFDVNVLTIRRWMIAHEAFCNSVRVGKDQADERVVHSLYQRAVGYEHDGVHYPPDPKSSIHWLNNRRPKEWRNQVTVDATVKTDGASSLGSILARIEQIEALLQGTQTINAQAVEVLPAPVNDAD